MFVKPIENFLGAFEKKFQPKKTGFVRIFQPDFELHFLLIFGLKLFSKVSRKFSIGLRPCSRYRKGPLNLALCVSKKIVTARHTNKKILAKKRKKKKILGNFPCTTVGA